MVCMYEYIARYMDSICFFYLRNIMRNVIFIIGMFISTLSVKAGDVSKYVLDNYLIPVNRPGATIGHICPEPASVRLLCDTSSLFRVDAKEKSISLKKKAVLTKGQAAYRYGVTLLIDGKEYEFELLKDGFSKNRIVAHRGAWRKKGVLQNSVRSFQNAVELGCQGSEMDVWLTADNKVILSHDPQVYGLEVENISSLQLFQQTIDKEDPVPSLQELLLVAKAQNITHPVIEIKDSQKGLERTLQLTDSVVNIVHRMKMQGYVEYISFNYEVLKRIRELDPTAKTLYLWEGKKQLEELVGDRISGIDYSYYAYRKDKDLLGQAKSKGLLTNVWTVNDAEDLLLFYQQGVDYITTDEPELLLKIINSLN